jgi:hypothetical protein
MPAAAVAVSGRARVVSSWLNLVERLVSEPTTKRLRRGTHRSVQELESRSATGSSCAGAVLGRANRDRRNAGGLLHVFPSEDIGQRHPGS